MLFENSSSRGMFVQQTSGPMGGMYSSGDRYLDEYDPSVHGEGLPGMMKFQIELLKRRILEELSDRAMKLRKPLIAICFLGVMLTMRQGSLSTRKAAGATGGSGAVMKPGSPGMKPGSPGIKGAVKSSSIAKSGGVVGAMNKPNGPVTVKKVPSDAVPAKEVVGATTGELGKSGSANVQRSMASYPSPTFEISPATTISTGKLCDIYGDRDDVQVAEFDTNWLDLGKKKAFSGPMTVIHSYEGYGAVNSAVSQTTNGGVLVVDGGGSTRVAVFNNAIAQQARAKGWSGVLIYGCVRNAELIEQVDIGIKALCTHPRMGKSTGGGAVRSVSFSQVEFIQGEYAYIDRDGVLLSRQQLDSGSAASAGSSSTLSTSGLSGPPGPYISNPSVGSDGMASFGDSTSASNSLPGTSSLRSTEGSSYGTTGTSSTGGLASSYSSHGSTGLSETGSSSSLSYGVSTSASGTTGDSGTTAYGSSGGSMAIRTAETSTHAHNGASSSLSTGSSATSGSTSSTGSIGASGTTSTSTKSGVSTATGGQPPKPTAGKGASTVNGGAPGGAPKGGKGVGKGGMVNAGMGQQAKFAGKAGGKGKGQKPFVARVREFNKKHENVGLLVVFGMVVCLILWNRKSQDHGYDGYYSYEQQAPNGRFVY